MNLRIGLVCVVAWGLFAWAPLGAQEPSAAPAQAKPQPTSDSLETVKNNLELKKAILVDVREQEEWDEGHVKDARHVPLSKIREGLSPDALPKDKIVYLHCRSGARSLIAQELLKKEGYDVRSLKQGYNDLLKAGFPKAP